MHDLYMWETIQNAATATGNGTALPVTASRDGPFSTFVAQVTGTFSATVTFEATLGESATQASNTWVAIPMRNVTTGAVATTTTAAGVFRGNCSGYRYVRARVTWTSGTSVTVLATLVPLAVDDALLSSGILGTVIVSSITAGETVIGLVGSSDIVVTVTPTLDTNAYSDNDLLFDSTAVANAVRANGYTCVLQSVTIIDKADQKQALTLFFANAATDFGTLNSAPDPDDTETATILGWVPVATTDYVDFGGAAVATVRGIGLLMKADAAATTLYVAGLAEGAATYGASDLVIQLGFLRS